MCFISTSGLGCVVGLTTSLEGHGYTYTWDSSASHGWAVWSTSRPALVMSAPVTGQPSMAGLPSNKLGFMKEKTIARLRLRRPGRRLVTSKVKNL